MTTRDAYLRVEIYTATYDDGLAEATKQVDLFFGARSWYWSSISILAHARKRTNDIVVWKMVCEAWLGSES